MITLLTIGYSAMVQKRTEVTMTVVGEANVLDVHSPRRDLQLIFRGEDLQQTNSNLRIVAVRVENTGHFDILQGHYDQREPWGFRVEGGRIVEARVATANSAYLARALNPVIRGDALVFDKPILERGKYVVVESTIVHTKGSSPRVKSFGKIAGVDEIPVEVATESPKVSRWRLIYEGPLWVHPIRAVIYTIAFFLALSLVGPLGIAVADVAEKKRRKGRQRLADSLGARSDLSSPLHEPWLKLYVDRGRDALLKSLSLVSDTNRLNATVRIVNAHPTVWNRALTESHLPTRGAKLPADDLAVRQARHIVSHSPDLRVLGALLQLGVIRIPDDGMAEVPQEAIRALREVIGAVG
ncbi:MAG TPA: hypothetical protein VGF69_14315 [Thermoanaerobaculia bacterium]